MSYGYSRAEFLQLTVRDIRPEADRLLFDGVLECTRRQQIAEPGIFRHQKKNGEMIQVELKVKPVKYQDVEAMLVLANDVTTQLQYIQTIETQNAAFKDITWMQSHVVRTPLARLMGLVELLDIDENPDEQKELFVGIQASAQELDSVIHSIVRKAESTQLSALPFTNTGQPPLA
ncbi:MAG: PAS domain S-box protein [Candidatus Sericytochromatia bacterium]|nr:PAS domain S-box protein [Candidatus Sericytochromatia bacterium]